MENWQTKNYKKPSWQRMKGSRPRDGNNYEEVFEDYRNDSIRFNS